MANTDYIEVKGPASLAELVAAIDASAPTPTGDVATIDLGGDEYVVIQYDAVDADTWPYLATIESRSDDEAPVRSQAMRIFNELKGTRWQLRLTSDADDTLTLLSPDSSPSPV
jgi:hypothetical protein